MGVPFVWRRFVFESKGGVSQSMPADWPQTDVSAPERAPSWALPVLRRFSCVAFGLCRRGSRAQLSQVLRLDQIHRDDEGASRALLYFERNEKELSMR